MTNETMIELCNAVSELAAERDEYRRKAESQAARHSDEVEALRAERDEARGELLEVTSTADRLSDELEDARGRLELQTACAGNALDQRDEQTARLAEAQAEIARLRAELDALKAGKVAVDMDEIEGVAFREFRDCPSFVVRECIAAAAHAVVAHLGLTPATPQTGEVGT